MFDTPIKLEKIPVVDLFAGPGGLGDGFSSFCSVEDQPSFEVVASAEKDEGAWHTLFVRSLFRHCKGNADATRLYRSMIEALVLAASSKAPLAGQKKVLDEFELLLPSQFRDAKKEILSQPTELGKRQDNVRLENRLAELGLAKKRWVLVGGPPCQAFSVVGRSRNSGNAKYDPFQDERISLYREYLKVLRKFAPSIFVMENVLGLATAKLGDELIVARMFRDLTRKFSFCGKKLGYELFALTDGQPVSVKSSEDLSKTCRKFVVRAEDYGIPQTRHRVIFVGVRKDLGIKQIPSLSVGKKLHSARVLSDLPHLSAQISRRSKGKKDLTRQQILSENAINLLNSIDEIGRKAPVGFNKRHFAEIVVSAAKNSKLYDIDSIRYLGKGSSADGSKGSQATLVETTSTIYNHEPRTHMAEDLARYFFCACWAKAHGKSPKAENFPDFLVPKHESFSTGAFSDRFRVQVSDDCSKTITSHISKDGHYFIHPDPAQCRSLTVREAARLQTFADDHFFMSSRTSQFQQVGNAVPPRLAKQIAGCVYESLFKAFTPETVEQI